MLETIWKRIITLAAFVVVFAGVTPAWAGELLVGAEPLEVDDKGNITKAGRAAAVTSIEALPGDTAWVLHLWAKIDKGAVGPMYVEFYRDHEGKKLTAYRDEHAEYTGDKFLSYTVEIPRSRGFRPDETIELAFVQALEKGDIKHAKGKVKLEKSSQPAPASADDAEPESEEPDDGLEDDDGDEPYAAPPPASTEPPPIEPASKKGCSTSSTIPPLGLTVLLLFAVARRRRPSAA
jgi:MYXO-CTERM domain-containing protein